MNNTPEDTTHTIEDVIKAAQKEYELKVTEDNKPKYLEFLQRQIDSNGYDLNQLVPSRQNYQTNKFIYFDLLVDKLYLFACLIREAKVMDTYDRTGTELKSDELLHRLRIRGGGIDLWEDIKLGKVYRSREVNYKNKIINENIAKNKLPKLLKYREIIDEIGKDPEIVRIWGRELSYDMDISTKVYTMSFLRTVPDNVF